MLIIKINKSQLSKFPKPTYQPKSEDIDGDVIVTDAPYTFELLAQNPKTFECVGDICGDLSEFLVSDIVYQRVTEIPRGFYQLCIDGKYGDKLTISQIQDIKADIIFLGNDADKAMTLSELKMLKRIKEIDEKIRSATDDIEQLKVSRGTLE